MNSIIVSMIDLSSIYLNFNTILDAQFSLAGTKQGYEI